MRKDQHVAHDDCHFCQTDNAASSDVVVYRDDIWTVGSVADVPGWIMIWANRHVEGGWRLAQEEAVTFGPLYVKVASALRKVCDAERVYMMYLGETGLHFHCLAIPRAADAPPERRGPGVVQRAAEFADRREAVRVAALVGQELGAS
jgi:diadenosine tetraphosphate (Ap4A) HIT family hydrolase